MSRDEGFATLQTRSIVLLLSLHAPMQGEDADQNQTRHVARERKNALKRQRRLIRLADVEQEEANYMQELQFATQLLAQQQQTVLSKSNKHTIKKQMQLLEGALASFDAPSAMLENQEHKLHSERIRLPHCRAWKKIGPVELLTLSSGTSCFN